MKGVIGMSIVRNQTSLYDFISTRLNANPYGITFRSDLFFSNKVNYWERGEDGSRDRFVPVIISDVLGQYLNVPNANSFSATAGIQFDVFIGVKDESDVDEAEYQDVEYEATMNAIEWFKASLLAQYFPLGTNYLYFGGEDSSADIAWTTTRKLECFYIDFTPYNTDAEQIIDYGVASNGNIDKTATKIRFEYTASNYLELDYTVNENIKIVIYHDGTSWNMVDSNGNSDSFTTANTLTTTEALEMGQNGLEGILKQVACDYTSISSFDFDDIEEELSEWFINFDTFTSKNLVSNSGDDPSGSLTPENCILWSEEGNAIFGFGTLNPISDQRVVDGTAYYQAFELEMPVFISNDVLFGNNFEYYLDGEQVFPVDRSHTLATDIGGAQYLNNNSNQFIVSESAREHSMSFYYIPSKKLNSLLKHTVTDDIEQNDTYTLLVQYPFFQETYEVIIENGGTQPNINTISTFTVTFKKADTILSS